VCESPPSREFEIEFGLDLILDCLDRGAQPPDLTTS
jgi:hypothetical protein